MDSQEQGAAYDGDYQLGSTCTDSDGEERKEATNIGKQTGNLVIMIDSDSDEQSDTSVGKEVEDKDKANKDSDRQSGSPVNILNEEEPSRPDNSIQQGGDETDSKEEPDSRIPYDRQEPSPQLDGDESRRIAAGPALLEQPGRPVSIDAEKSVTEDQREQATGRVAESDPETERINRKREENRALLLQLGDQCNRIDQSEVWLLLGVPGAGKSALINTVIKAITGNYFHRAKTGKGIAASKTLTLDRLENCGVLKGDTDPGTREDIVLPMIDKLPTIYDAAGRGDENSPKMAEMLEMIIRGFIPPGTPIGYIESKQTEYGVGNLATTRFRECKPEWRITKVIFVQNCRDPLPTQLVSCLQDVLKKTDNTGSVLCPCDVFVVITKYDLVRDHDSSTDALSKDFVSKDKFNKLEKEIAEKFSLEGAMEESCIRWMSYVDGQARDNPEIDNTALTFLVKMLKQSYKPPTKSVSQVSEISTFRHYMFKIRKMVRESVPYFHMNFWVFIFGGVVVCVLSVLIWVLNKKVT